MSRLSPLIVRRVGSMAPALPLPEAAPLTLAEAATWLHDVRLFATGWVGGLVFFGTLFG